MASYAEARWGKDGVETVSTADELDVLLARVEREARRSGLPQHVQLYVEDAGSLGIVVGHDRSVVDHVPEDLDPPYAISLGDEDGDRPFTFYVDGDHHGEARWRHTVPATQAFEAARVFLASGALDDKLRWEKA
jgi:immunity protein Imm1 of predicted polymorphic toxin system